MKATKKERKKRKAKICFKFGQQQKHSIQEETAIARKKKRRLSHTFFLLRFFKRRSFYPS